MTRRTGQQGFRAFLLLWLGQSVSLLGSSLTGFALGVWVYQRVFAVRRMIAWASLPLAYVIAGPLADRVFEPLIAEGGRLACGTWIRSCRTTRAAPRLLPRGEPRRRRPAPDTRFSSGPR